MYNDTTRVLPYSSGQMVGVILPHSEKILSSQDLDRKIAKEKGHIERLSSQLHQAHGGKALRSRRISLQNQIFLASDRLTLLQVAKTAVPEVQVVAPTQESIAPPVLSTMARVSSLVSRLLGLPAPTGFTVGSSSTVEFGGGVRTFTVINTRY